MNLKLSVALVVGGVSWRSGFGGPLSTVAVIAGFAGSGPGVGVADQLVGVAGDAIVG